jgi:hypothetical protein
LPARIPALGGALAEMDDFEARRRKFEEVGSATMAVYHAGRYAIRTSDYPLKDLRIIVVWEATRS